MSKIFDFIEKYDMLSSGDSVICGLSGGADSVFLLLTLCGLRERLGISVEALHVNHCLRGSESDRDERFCRELCDRLGIPFTAVSCDVKGFAEKNSLSCEESARILRYDIFSRYSVGKKIATAHNADDNLETVIHNLIRGTALKGLTGIPPVRGNIIRPILTVSRREIEEYLEKIGQDYVTDSTNLTDDYTRNKIRHRIIPLMREINGSLTETSVRSVDSLRSENSLIETEVNNALGKCLDGGIFTGLAEYNEVIRRRCISRLLGGNNLPVSNKRLTDCDRVLISGGKINISGDIYFVSDGRTAELKTIAKADSDVVSKALEIGENVIFSGAKLVCELVECDNSMKSDIVNKKLTFYLLDYDKIIGRAVVRSRKFGDRIRLSGRDFTSSVKKLINEKIPDSIKPTLHFIEDDMGTVFAENIGIAGRAEPDENTRRLLKIHVVRN
ncbi:MAG: tRNA lysidine(34) synthetase TilS [Ruminococcus flavefaciens]|nr:tRNA lysidine(34) synthetase TilS [Ruminococcus flavefaciens]MCM1229217.1 tRNA lysidine(34) synthetase TilS [Ruminococcus flavefaciens]